jgi:hypothetical protein
MDDLGRRQVMAARQPRLADWTVAELAALVDPPRPDCTAGRSIDSLVLAMASTASVVISARSAGSGIGMMQTGMAGDQP